MLLLPLIFGLSQKFQKLGKFRDVFHKGKKNYQKYAILSFGYRKRRGEEKHRKEEDRKRQKRTTLATALLPAPWVKAAILLPSEEGFCVFSLDLARLLPLFSVKLTPASPELTFFCERG